MTVILDYKEFVFGTEKLMCMLWSGCTLYISTYTRSPLLT